MLCDMRLLLEFLLFYFFYSCFLIVYFSTMPNVCCVEGCQKTPPSVTLHRFPKDTVSCLEWKEALGRPAAWVPTESDRVCSTHFDPAALKRGRAQVRVMECAIPRKSVFSDRVTDLTDHTYALPDGKVLKRRVDILVKKVEDRHSKSVNANKREKRLRVSMACLLEKLKEQQLINQEAHMKLEAYSDIPLDLFNRPVKEYTDEQKDFALTLHMQSGKA